MILVADSGSTCTDWIIINDNHIKSSFSTRGFNPYFTSSKKLSEDLISELPANLNRNAVSEIYFYGSGCSSQEMQSLVAKGLSLTFNNSEIEVNHDLLGAARALLKNEAGIVIILGTGANTGFYDGHQIVENIPSLGFILGDEGGGDYLGKLFITEILYNQLPENIANDFYATYNLTNSKILYKIYKEEHPNQFLASICEFIFKYKSNKNISDLIKKSFYDLFKKHIIKYANYQKYKIRVVGSIGYYFKEFLQNTAKEFNVQIDNIEQKPIRKLAEYHLK